MPPQGAYGHRETVKEGCLNPTLACAVSPQGGGGRTQRPSRPRAQTPVALSPLQAFLVRLCALCSLRWGGPWRLGIWGACEAGIASCDSTGGPRLLWDRDRERHSQRAFPEEGGPVTVRVLPETGSGPFPMLSLPSFLPPHGAALGLWPVLCRVQEPGDGPFLCHLLPEMAPSSPGGRADD